MAIGVEWARAEPTSRPDAEIHVWRVDLDALADSQGRLAEVLWPDERARVSRLVREQDRARFTARRAVLRLLLGRYTGRPADQCRLSVGPFGKPVLAPGEDGRACTLHFSVSHSSGVALVAFCTAVEIGVDLERVKPAPELDAVVRHFFSPTEAAALAGCPPDDRLEALYNWWTRKEACLKAAGCGLAVPLERLQVSLVPGEPARVIECHPDLGLPAEWRVEPLAPEPGWVGTAAWRGPDQAVRCFTWDPGLHTLPGWDAQAGASAG